MTTPEAPAAPARLGRGAQGFLACLFLAAAWSATSSYFAPPGWLPYMPPGGADLIYPYNGARALLAGVNPYTHELPWLFDPWAREGPIEGVTFRQYYPPSHFVLDVPLVLASGSDPQVGTRLFFLVNLGALAGLVWGAASVARSLGALPGDTAPLVAGLMFLGLAASPGGALVLECGQSDLVLGLSTWAGAWLCLRRKAAVGTFVLSVGVLCKGYSVVSAGGVLLLVLLDARTRRGALLGAAAAAAVFLAPVLHLLPDGIRATRQRAVGGMIMNDWYNHSFSQFWSSISPSLTEPGRAALTIAALLGAGACFVGAYRARKAGPEEPAQAARLVWTALFMTVGLVAVIGWSPVSVNYNLFNLLPGALVLGLVQERFPELLGLTARRAASVLLAAAIGCMCLSHGPSPTFPVATLGLIALIVLAGLCGAAALRPPGAASAPIPAGAHA